MKGHIANKNGRYYPVLSIKDLGTGKWKRKWLAGYKTKKEAQKTLTEAMAINKVCRLVEENKIPYKQVGRIILFSRKRINEWIEEQHTGGSDERTYCQ
jgi:excisionase family DNA binding protein